MNLITLYQVHIQGQPIYRFDDHLPHASQYVLMTFIKCARCLRYYFMTCVYHYFNDLC